MDKALQQMNISYHPNEDRLLFKISTQDNNEFRVWLTRRFTALMLKVLSEAMEEHGGPQTLASSDDTRERLKQGAFDQDYTNQPNAAHPLGENGVLAFRLNFGSTEDGKLNLQLLPEAGEGLNLNLDKSMIYMVHSLLLQGMASSDWNLNAADLPTDQLH